MVRRLIGSFFCSLLAAVILVVPSLCTGAEAPAAVFDVTNFGAIPDDNKSDTQAIQAAIDECHQQKGGTVRLTTGEFQAGTLELRDHVTLEVSRGATLRASKNAKEFKEYVWLFARNAKQIGLKGEGIITGNGSDYFKIEPRQILAWIADGAKTGKVTHPIQNRAIPYSYSVQFSECQDVSISGLRFLDSPHWTVHTLACDRVNIDKVTIRNLFYGPYTDGFDIDACNDVTVKNCVVTAGDDAFCVKNTNKLGLARPCSRILFEDCIARSATNGFKIGTETQDDISHVTFRRCRVEPAAPGVNSISGIAIETVDGGNLTDVLVEDIHMTSVRSPLLIRLGNRGRGQTKSPVRPGNLQNVVVQRIRVDLSTLPIVISGIPERDIENVVLDDLQISVIGGSPDDLQDKVVPELEFAYPEATMFGELPTFGLFCRHVNGIKISKTVITPARPDARKRVQMIDVKQADIEP